MIFKDKGKTKHPEKRNPFGEEEPTKTQPTTRHFKNKKGTGAEMRPAIVSGIVPVSNPLFLCPLRQYQKSLRKLTRARSLLVSEVENWRGDNKR